MPARPISPSRVLGYVALAAVFALHAAVLLQSPVVGTAENGDFWRVMKPAGILPIDEYSSVDHKYVSQFYGVKHSDLGAGFSSAAVIALAAKWLGGGQAPMDIRQVGATYLLLVAGTLALALAAGLPPLLAALLAWAALDVSYSLYFNSFFADGAALLGILGVVLALLRWPAAAASAAWRAAHHVLLIGAALTIGLSKNLYMLTPLLVAAIVLASPQLWAGHARAAGLLIAALLVGGIGGIWHFTYGSGYRFPAINHHHVVFYGLANVADDPTQLLGELGLDAGLAPFAGKNYFELSADDKTRSKDALSDLSRGAVVRAYVLHPRRMLRAVALALPPLHDTVSADPNFSDRSRPPANYAAWWQFARLRGSLWPLAVTIWLGGVAVLLHAAWRQRWTGTHAALAFLLLNAVTLVVASILGDGFFGMRRHTMGARFSLDLALAIELFVAVCFAIARLRRPGQPRATPPAHA